MDILLKVAGANARQAMNAKNEDGDTPLMVAARSAVSGVLMHNPFGPPMKPLGICKEMIERGADKSITRRVRFDGPRAYAQVRHGEYELCWRIPNCHGYGRTSLTASHANHGPHVGR